MKTGLDSAGQSAAYRAEGTQETGLDQGEVEAAGQGGCEQGDAGATTA
jgi:hypothetical protein